MHEIDSERFEAYLTMIEEMEDNENNFVALWSERVELDCAVLYVNSVMTKDPFLNRITDINCRQFCTMLNSAEVEAAKRNVKLFVYSLLNERLEMELGRRGYVLYDIMSELLYEGRYALRYSPDIRNKRVERSNIDEWIDVYCTSFEFGKYREEIRRVICNSFERLHLYLAYVGNSPAGCASLFEKNSFLGLYCLGTLPKYRRAGIATALISIATNVAKERDLRLLVQSFKSGEFISYYIKRGFTQIYTKNVYTKT